MVHIMRGSSNGAPSRINLWANEKKQYLTRSWFYILNEQTINECIQTIKRQLYHLYEP